MWVRTQLKISSRDLAAALFKSYASPDGEASRRRLESYFAAGGQALACYSVRSGFDLVLQGLDLQPGDEVIFTALNVKAMVRVVKNLGLTPVPVDVDLSTMAPVMDKLERAITPRSKVFVAAHLFGTRIDLSQAFQLAKSRGLLTVEDCAQAFNGKDYLGSADADVVMFSFGPIKTATALGGAVLCVKDASLRQRMVELQSRYPAQSNAKQRKRIMKFLGLKLLTSPRMLSAIYKFYHSRGGDFEDSLANKVRDVAPLNTVDKTRVQPSPLLLWMMDRQIHRFQIADVAARSKKGRTLTGLVNATAMLPGQSSVHHDYWVYPVLVKDRKELIADMRAAGFDAADLPRSQHIAAPPDRPELEPQDAAALMKEIVILPCYPDMPDSELRRQAAILASYISKETRP